MKGNFRLAKGVLGQGRQNFDPLVSENVRSLTALPVDLRLPGVSQRAGHRAYATTNKKEEANLCWWICRCWLVLQTGTDTTLQMFTSLDKITQEISTQFQQLHELDNQFCFLVPS